ncbi:DNA-directed RNA polymerase Rpb11 13-16kDa subunit conserved site [Venturia nashicola]|uniref:DNA-directed RNA polymerase Rpb11 13-16kDa subunit conserved site n=1 Tax=Venturia nashicola TaxID=86259 RepID=A0A4Z1PID2_9PEZI|nr:DNA-directed RNA polymerase Rpb11 13-16kDa subunit conserved site [Venturia nashicola]TLD39440.1 DNA-directed RNA polymerase Rpb11 13-16kDa subunit conserved site [Venturia nashicola]
MTGKFEINYFPTHPHRILQAHATMGYASDRIDVPDRYELFLLDEEKGEKKVTYILDTRVPNTAIFTFNKEDHTLGNLLTERLHSYPFVHFSAYKVPHPLFATFELRVSTDGTLSPKEALLQACREIISDLLTLKGKFTHELEVRALAREGMGM